MLNIWKDYYVIRRSKLSGNENGYAMTTYKDYAVYMDVQPAGSHNVNGAEGKRTTTTIQAISDFAMYTADARTGKAADMLYFDGSWYQCESSQIYRHTPMRHCTATFIKLTEAVDKAVLKPPGSYFEKEENWGEADEIN